MLQQFWFARETILVLGDSHANVFKHWRFRFNLPRCRFIYSIVGGATVSGLDNPNSQTQALCHFKNALQAHFPTVIITLLGEVDTGFVIWYRAKKYHQSVDFMLDMAVSNYEKLLQMCCEVSPVVVLSAPLPTIRDNQDWGEVANQRKAVDASLKDRTDLTLEFNRRISESADKIGCSFLSLDEDCIAADGTVDRIFLNTNCLDHHYSTAPYAHLVATRLPPLLRKAALERLQSAHRSPINNSTWTKCRV